MSYREKNNLNITFDIIDMKIINKSDINDLILYAKKNLGIYQLVYKKEVNRIYFFSIILFFISVFLLLMCVLLICFHKDKFFIIISGIFCLFTCFCTLILLRYIDNKTKHTHLKIQYDRQKLLKKYYNDKNYTSKEIKVINQQLEKRKDKIEKNKVTILVVIGVLILPVWDIFIQKYMKDFSLIRIVKFILFVFIFSIVVLLVIRFFNKILYRYEEFFYKTNNTAIIENLIYLNEYIIQENEKQNNNGRRR